MPQIFHRSFNTLSKVSIFGAIFILAFIAWAYGQYVRSSYATGVGVAIDQPVPFSHRHHVGELGIDCRYCHASVEQSGFAGLPPTKTCMNCHSQLWLNSPLLEPVRDSFRTGDSIEWVRVHNLADFVYFDHSIHIAKGVGCASCHGPVHDMPLMRQVVPMTMEWCLQCHRNPAPHLRPMDEIFNTALTAEQARLKHNKTPEDLMKDYKIMKIERLIDCTLCHR